MNFRSGFERTLVSQMNRDKIVFDYEPIKLPYVINRTYSPDFVLANGVIVEAKGVLDKDTRQKMLAVKKQHPELDIRIVFMNAKNKVSGSKKSYGEWAAKNGFIWADGVVPKEWSK